jgi:hypothetical protein
VTGAERAATAPMDVAAVVETAGQALLGLHDSGRPALATTLARLVEVVAGEAARSGKFAGALERALTVGDAPPAQAMRRTGRRTPGLLDPFAVYTDVGEVGLRERLAALDLEQLRDIVAEHGMDHDRLAMKWKDPERVIGRIVERVAARSAKGSAFRAPTRP